jgi:hypothetical protein
MNVNGTKATASGSAAAGKSYVKLFHRCQHSILSCNAVCFCNIVGRACACKPTVTLI